MEISFVDENDFVKEGKWYFFSDNSQWKISSTLYGRLGNKRPFPSKVKNTPYFLLETLYHIKLWNSEANKVKNRFLVC